MILLRKCEKVIHLSTNYWTMWSTMFAFQPWHSVAEMRRYMRRFMHLLPGFNRLEGIFRTRLNQYDSIVRPVEAWLRDQGVTFHLNTPVTDVVFDDEPLRVTQLSWRSADQTVTQNISENGRVLITLGSMTEGSSLGTTHQATAIVPAVEDGSWALWRRIAKASPRFGRPERFAGSGEAAYRTMWESFTVTLRSSAFHSFMASFTGNAAGTGGLVTLKDSAWTMSVVLPHQPHFEQQHPDTFVFWGYGLYPTNTGDKVDKPMLECSGEEILLELAHHLGLSDQFRTMFDTAICIPCIMPFITSQFMPRSPADRPPVLPVQDSNFAFLGQFCEIDDDTVFTVEYSVRSAFEAVYGLCDVTAEVPAMYRGFEDRVVLGNALRTLLRNGKSPRR